MEAGDGEFALRLENAAREAVAMGMRDRKGVFVSVNEVTRFVLGPSYHFTVILFIYHRKHSREPRLLGLQNPNHCCPH